MKSLPKVDHLSLISWFFFSFLSLRLWAGHSAHSLKERRRSRGNFILPRIMSRVNPQPSPFYLCLLPTTTSQSRCVLWEHGCFLVAWRKSLSLEVGHKCRTKSLLKCALLSPSPLFFLLPRNRINTKLSQTCLY